MSQVTTQPSTPSQPRLNIYGYNCIARHIAMVVLTCAPLFIGAATLDWNWAWVYSVVLLIGWIILSLILVRVNPELLNQRGRRARDISGTKRWDWLILAAYTLLLLVTPLVAGLDYRYGWSAPTWDGIKIIGNLTLMVSLALLTWSMAVNRFFEATVRIQNDRGQHVAATGPYHYVRHPGYVAVILHFIAIPLSIGSWASVIPTLLAVALFAYRTLLEDRTLQHELPGYKEYAERVRYRLLPGVW